VTGGLLGGDLKMKAIGGDKLSSNADYVTMLVAEARCDNTVLIQVWLRGDRDALCQRRPTTQGV
jgi:hypothetical protein